MGYQIPEEIKNVLEKFKSSGFQIYVVGGAVRDLLMNREVHDWDLTTDAKPEEIQKLFPNSFYDNKFGTVGIPITAPHTPTVILNNSEESQDSKPSVIEVTTMRKEGLYKDSRHPIEVSWTNKIEEDLKRRDFTINAIAISETEDLIDPFEGKKDLEEKLIRAVGDPTLRFQEDALRLIRAIRIATQIEFDIEKNTFSAIKLNASLIKEIANERIRDELFKIFESMNPYVGIVKLREAGILQLILPELERCFGLIQEGPKHDRVYDIGEHSLLTLKFTDSPQAIVRFAALLHDIGKPDTASKQKDGNVTFYNHDLVGGQIVTQIAKRFNLSKKQTDKMFRLVRWHLFTVDENQTDSAIRRYIKNVGLENLEDMMLLRIGDRLGGGTQKAISWRMEKFQERIKQVLHKPFSISDLKVNGQDVMDTLKLKPSRKVGEILQALFDEVLEDADKNNRDYLLKRITEIN